MTSSCPTWELDLDLQNVMDKATHEPPMISDPTSSAAAELQEPTSNNHSTIMIIHIYNDAHIAIIKKNSSPPGPI